MSEKIRIGMDAVVAGLKEIVEEFGPDTTRQCQYLEYRYDGDPASPEEIPVRPHCIVGVFLNRNGISLDELTNIEGETMSRALGKNLSRVELTWDAADILRLAQAHQDNGADWGVALAYAESEAAVIRADSNGVYDLT